MLHCARPDAGPVLGPAVTKSSARVAWGTHTLQGLASCIVDFNLCPV